VTVTGKGMVADTKKDFPFWVRNYEAGSEEVNPIKVGCCGAARQPGLGLAREARGSSLRYMPPCCSLGCRAAAQPLTPPPTPTPTHPTPPKMEVGIEDCLHIEFEYDRPRYHLKDCVVGKIYFLLVRG
jgi:hypothetical protein